MCESRAFHGEYALGTTFPDSNIPFEIRAVPTTLSGFDSITGPEIYSLFELFRHDLTYDVARAESRDLGVIARQLNVRGCVVAAPPLLKWWMAASISQEKFENHLTHFPDDRTITANTAHQKTVGFAGFSRLRIGSS